jgi:gramicidin S synthase 2/tyrocidine synthetase-3
MDEFREAKQYWLEALKNEPPQCRLPEDLPGAAAEESTDWTFLWDEELSSAVLARCRGNHLALFTLLLATLGIVVSRYGNDWDLALAAPVYNPGNRRFNRLIPFRIAVDPESSFKHHVAAVKTIVEQGYKNEHFPMVELAPDSAHPLASVAAVVALENIHGPELEWRDDSLPAGTVTIACRHKEDCVEGMIRYPKARFEEDTIRRVADSWRHVLTEALEAADKSLMAIDVMSSADRRRLLDMFSTPDSGSSTPEQTVTRMFELAASRRGEAVAVSSTIDMMNIYDELRPEQIPIDIDYRQLNSRANRLAALLRRHGVGPDSIVAMWLRHPLETVVAIWGVLKSGAAYLPLDTGYPTALTAYILNDSAAAVIVSEPDLVHDLPPQSADRTVLMVDAWAEGLEDTNPQPLHQPGDLAYAIYTSGTTGKPKGVLVEHRAIANYAQWRLRDYQYTDREVTLQLLPYSFDGFCSNFYCGLLCGGRLVMTPEDKRLDIGYIHSSIRRLGVTNTSLVPGVFRLLLEGADEGDLDSLRMVVLAGERSDSGLLEKSRRLAPNAQLVNEYGPTEATVAAAANKELSLSATDVIGVPIDNTSIVIMDENRQLQPMKAPGELCVSGAGVARGYLNQPELTARRFEHNPLAEGQKLYRSGDVAQYLPNGSIRLAGRLDYQVKIRGYRIETAAVQTALKGLDGVEDAVVVCWNDGGDAALVGYVVPAGQKPLEDCDPALLKTQLAEVLPNYMIPTFIIPLGNIPLTPNGKPDHRALPQPGQSLSADMTPPRDSVEETLAKIWAEILGVEASNIGIDQSFFDIGGHSLKAAVLESMINKRFQVFLPLADIFQIPTIRELAAAIAERGVSPSPLDDGDDNLSLLRDGDGADLFVIHDGSGGLEAYLPLCRCLDPSIRCWGIRADRRDSVAPFTADLEELAQTYADIIIKAVPKGPLSLTGWSAGGSIAFAVAHCLESRGRDVAMLGLLDAPAPHEGAATQALTLETEWEWVTTLIPQLREEPSLSSAQRVEDLWDRVLDCLQKLHITMEDIETMIRRRRNLALPASALKTSDTLLRFMNNGRSYVSARDRYTPPGPLNGEVVLFKANRAADDFKLEWNRYARRGLQVQEVDGDHFSLMVMPEVEGLAKTFSLAMDRCGNLGKGGE